MRWLRVKICGATSINTSESRRTLPVRVCSSSSFSRFRSWCCSAAASSAANSSLGGHGLHKKRNTRPVLTAAIAAFSSAWPVSKTRVELGAISAAHDRNFAPSIRGMRMSETIATKSCSLRSSSASAASGLVSVMTSKPSRNVRSRPSSSSGSSSTHSTQRSRVMASAPEISDDA